MLLNVVEDKSILVAEFAEDFLQIEFFSTPTQFVIEKSDSRYFLAIKKNIRLLAQTSESVIKFEFQKDSEYARLISFKLNYDALVSSYDKKIEFMINDNLYVLEIDQGKIEIDYDGNILLSLVGISTNAIIYNVQNQFSFKQLTINTNNTNITDYSYMPEFSIACFDDSSFAIPRQVRFGKPVISTVPANITTSSNQDDIDFFNNGKGPNSKTIYFRIICNKILETLSSNDLSELKLKVYMPSGLDTVKSAEYVDMYFVSNDSTNNMSIYKAQYNFYIQGNFNGIDYVDGLMYFDVQVPLTVQSYMPIQFDFSL
jgi:hypothetical protein